MEAVWADVATVWIWRDGGPYFGVPRKQLPWLAPHRIHFYQLFAFYLRNLKASASSPSHGLMAVAFYALSALGNLLFVAPSSLSSVFVDVTGRQWSVTHILLTSQLVSLFLMFPLSLIAWARISSGWSTRFQEV